MKISIDEDICTQYNLTISDLFMLLYLRTTENAKEHFNSMLQNELIVEKDINNVLSYKIPLAISEKVDTILLNSDNSVPKPLDCEKLAIELRSLFPKGIKTGSSAWRGNIREITLRLQKFFKLYGDNFTNEQIVDATKKYISSFNGNYTYMRILKYFILKSDRKMTEEGTVVIEEISELANWLDAKDDTNTNNDWTVELR